MRLLGHVFLGSTIIIASKERLLCNGYRYIPSCSSKHRIQKSSSPQIAIEKILKNIYKKR